MQFKASANLPCPIDQAFAWHGRPGAFQRLLPPWQNIQIIDPIPSIQNGATGKLRMKLGPIPMDWDVEHLGYNPPHQFEDRQIKGPFKHWHHKHRFTADPDNPSASILTDDIEYDLKAQPMSGWLLGGFVEGDLQRVFRYRHAITQNDLAFHQSWSPKRLLHIAISGSSGLVGKQLAALFTTAGHRVTSLVRRRDNLSSDEACWLPDQGIVGSESQAKLTGCDAIIHLAGAGIADQRWTKERKQVLRDSRVAATQKLAQSLLQLDQPPRAFIGASAIGYYGNRGDEILDESALVGEGFLAELANDWELATQSLTDAGIRVAHGRIGLVMTSQGGALQKLLPPARFGLGGPLGSGQQWYSPISLDDVLYALAFLAYRDDLSGPFNLTCPNPLPQHELAKCLGRVLHRPAFLPAPGLALRLMLGEMADELLLASMRVVPNRLQQAGFEFRHPDCESILRHVLGVSS